MPIYVVADFVPLGLFATNSELYYIGQACVVRFVNKRIGRDFLYFLFHGTNENPLV